MSHVVMRMRRIFLFFFVFYGKNHTLAYILIDTWSSSMTQDERFSQQCLPKERGREKARTRK